MAVKLNKHDLEFILKQIKIAEAHASGIPLTEIRVDADGNYDANGRLAISQPHLPYGLRTVDGTYNNILPGRELWGAADQTMPRMFQPYWRNETDDSHDTNGTQPGGVVSNGNYNTGGATGSIADADPRIISNLIVDQTPNNPAALIAALRHAGHEGDLTAMMASITTPYALVHAANVANGRVASWQKLLDDVNAAIQAALDAGETPDPTWAASIPMLEGNLAAATAAAIAPNAEAASYQLVVPDGADPDSDPDAIIVGAQNVVDHVAAELGIEFEVDGRSLKIPNVAPDEGLSAPFNGWMTFFGQFFDHGLDLISKGGDGTIYVPLQPDDPLYVPDGFTNFMVLTRATQIDGPGPDGITGTSDDTRDAVNVTTPFVDQNQTYTSHPSHQVFLREYELVGGVPLATGRLLDGATGGLPTWKDVKEQALTKLGIELTDRDVFNIPLIRTDPYGEFIRDAAGFPQVIVDIGVDGVPNTADDIVMSGTPSDPVRLNPAEGGTEPVRTSHSFLDDIAHTAVPVLDTQGLLQPDGETEPGVDPAGNAVQFNPLRGINLEYDNELLDAHYVTGDGRGNENIGLTAVHHVFHAEHNRQVEVNKKHIVEMVQSGEADVSFLNEWLLEEVAALPADPSTLAWDGERLFQTARFATEMQYQHLVFEEFGRKVQPMIDVFVFNTITDIDPAIFAEFANVVYRFGHSMLTEEITRMFLDADGNPIRYENGTAVPVAPGDLGNWAQDIGLIEAFLNPIEFDKGGTISHDQAAGAIFRGMTLVHGNEIDEFVVDALRNNLLGLPLDLAAINIARGRDTGMPTLNGARAQLYQASSSTFVEPYESWAEFAANLKNPASVINFIAAYGTHDTIEAEQTMDGKRAAATALVLNQTVTVTIAGVERTFEPPADRVAFLNATGWTDSDASSETGLNLVDLWIGGLAEKKMPFGGMLGSTFNAVFEAQLEMLQDLDRFYYLTRTQGLNLLNELENNAFSKLIAANTDMTDAGPDGVRGTADDGEINFPTGVDSFAKHDFVLNIDPDKQVEVDPEHDDAALNALGMTKVQRDNPLTAGVDESLSKDFIRFLGGEHTVIGGSAAADTIISDYGDDAIWGGAGDDRIESGAGVDFVIGGAGNDIITDSGDTGDFIKGEDGDDIIANANGLDVLMGGDGKDVFFVGVDGTEVFAGEGDDFVLGGADLDFLMGNEGDDWMEGGDGFDVLAGENSELFFNSTIIGHDVLIAGENENDFDAESGDDIMVQGESVMRNEGMFGFDWAIHKGNRVAADSDMRIPIFTTVADDILRDRFDQTEGLSGWIHNDVLRGDDRGSDEEVEIELDMTNHELTQAGVDRITGLRDLLGNLIADIPVDYTGDLETLVAFDAGNIMIGGDGNDTFEGRGGDDFIHGDAWLNVRIRITAAGAANTPEAEIATVDTLKHVFQPGETATGGAPIDPAWVGKSLYELMTARVIVPNQLHIVREILYDPDPSSNVDTAIFAGNRDWYEITEFENGSVRVARREMEEVDPQIAEGTDTLVGIERIQFADQTLVLSQSGNHEPTGRLVLQGLPAREDEPLTVSAAEVYDANNPGAGPGNVGNITYRWQIERNDGTGDYIDIPGTFGSTFTPGDEHTGLRIRVIGTYVDAGGVTETVMSLPTDLVIGVNDDPVGALLISDATPTEGQLLTATVAFTDADGITDAFEEGLLTYQWQWSASGNVNPADPEQGWNDIGGPSPTSEYLVAGGTGSGAMGGRYLRVKVEYTDDLGNVHVVRSAPTTTVVGNAFSSNDSTINGSDGATAGDDLINGGSSSNTIFGLGGNDVINGGSGNTDTLNGGDGNDTLDGQGGNDNVNGEAGDDTIIYRNDDGDDQIDGGAGNDTVRIVGASTASNDSMNVTFDGASITNVLGANNDDADLIGVEHVNLDLGGGTDTLSYANTDVDVEVDLLTGAASGFSFIRNVENVVGGDGDDTIQGDNLANVLSGGNGADVVRGGFGNDTVGGGAGDDLLYGEQGDDVIDGGAGNDRVDGGEGSDTASYASADAAVSVTLAGTATTVAAAVAAGQEDLLVSIENLTGSSFNDTLAGNAGDNVIDGGGGADLMEGGAGDDTYVINDVTGGATDRDRVVEGPAGGNDTVQGSVSIDLTAVGLAGQEIENIVLTGGGNTNATGNALDNQLTGNAGNNVLDGGLGNDTVVLAGAIGTYTFGRNPANSPTNGTAADTLTTVTVAGGGTDTLVGVEYAQVEGASYRIVAGTNAANPALNGAGNGGDELVLGFDGNDGLAGGDGNDILIGGNGDDSLDGGAGDDQLLGGAGTDTLTGGAGNDTLDGGTSTGASETFADNFNGTETYADDNGTLDFTGPWTETNDGSGSAGGDIEITGSRLHFDQNITGGEAIQRVFNAAGASSVTISFDFEDDSVGGGDSVLVQARNVDTNAWETLISGSFGGALGSGTSNGDGTFDATLNADQIGANSAIRFLAQGNWDNGDNLYIDNVVITVSSQGGDLMTGGEGDDVYHVDGTSGANIDQVVEGAGANSGTDTVVLTASGSYTLAANVENLIVQGGGNRTLTGNALDNEMTGGTGNDLIDGAGGADTAVYAGPATDYVIGTSGGNITVSGAGIGTDTLANVEQIRFLDRTLAINNGSTGDDDITVTGDAARIILGREGNDTIVGGDGHDVIIGGAGNDTLFGSEVGTAGDNATSGAEDNDTFIWNATGADGFGDGVDTIDGGFEGADGDIFVVNGNNSSETFGIYTYDEAVAQLGYGGDDEVEIVVTRHTGSNDPTIIAELADIEEILVNPGGGSNNNVVMYGDFSLTSLRPDTITVVGGSGDDTVDISSLLSAHRVVFRTGGGNDVIIGTLRPQDVIELPDGTAVDDYAIVENPDGSTTLVGDAGSVTFFSSGGLPQFGSETDSDDEEDNDSENDSNSDSDGDNNDGADDTDDAGSAGSDADDSADDTDDDTDDDDDTTDGSADDDEVTSLGTGAARTGTAQTDTLVGTTSDDNIVALGGDDVVIGDAGADAISAGDGADFVNAGAGRDLVFAGAGDDQVLAGSDADIVYGDAGADRMFGDDGDDLLTGGAGDDAVFGGAGNDLIVGEVGDGNDVYFGDDSTGGTGIDTLDLSAATVATTVHLGSGPLAKGSASSSQTGNDTLWGIENVNTGSGEDTIVAGSAVNVMDGGGGNDTFRFGSAQAADGDTIRGFEPGDRIDLSEIDADTGGSGDQSFTLVSGGALTAAGQLAVTHESRAEGDFTLVQGTVDGNGADFRIELEGHHTLDESSFNL